MTLGTASEPIYTKVGTLHASQPQSPQLPNHKFLHTICKDKVFSKVLEAK